MRGLLNFHLDSSQSSGYLKTMPESLYDTFSALQDAEFHEAVYKATKLIPVGKVLGYGHLATLIGRQGCARQVGRALSRLGADARYSLVPWWRVLRSDGSIAMQGDPTRGPAQIALLRAERVPFKRPHIVDMRMARWQPELD